MAGNKILESNATKSQNFYRSDKILQHFLKTYYTKNGFAYMNDKLDVLGEKAATVMNKLSMLADKNSPKLNKRDAFGEEVNQIEFHPAYDELKKIALASEMFRVKWETSLKEKFKHERHALGFGAGYLFAMVEAGLFCPLCMTDGVARILNKYASQQDKAKLLPKIATADANNLYTGAMFLTEKAGGSDVGANLVSATSIGNGYYVLNGEKWFCSNANAEIILILARTNPTISGTKGLSIFLIEKEKPDGTVNYKNIVRLKDKIGVRSMASAEIILEDTVGKLLGKEGQGFLIMAEMINLSRLYNSVTASAIIRRALVEAYQYLSYRKTFGKIAVEHPLVKDKLAELAAIHQANFYFTWHTILTLDKADNNNKGAQQLLRILTPLLKKSTAEAAVYVCREAMEAIGGIAYIEENIIPKLLRDALVLPIWEGAGNIMVLDMLRAAFKENALAALFTEMNIILKNLNDDFLINQFKLIQEKATALMHLKPSEMELEAKYFFKQLTNLYQLCLLGNYKDDGSKVWIEPAIVYLKQYYFNAYGNQQLLNKAEVEAMLAWAF